MIYFKERQESISTPIYQEATTRRWAELSTANREGDSVTGLCG